MVGFLVAGPLSGFLSDRFGARWFATGGMLISALGFALLNTLGADFTYTPFAIYLAIIGFGMGMFASPNSAMVMNAVPARFRGVASGMRATFMNAGQMMSMGIFFSIVIAGLAQGLPQALTKGLTAQGLPATVIHQAATLPPTVSLFAALLGFNPLTALVPASTLHQLPPSHVTVITGHAFFPSLIGGPFMHGLSMAFWISAALSVIAALASAVKARGHDTDTESESDSMARQSVTVGVNPSAHQPSVQLDI